MRQTVSLTIEYIEKNSIPEPNSGCLIWTGELNAAGYGCISIGNAKRGTRIRSMAHRVSYELAKGPIPKGLDLDHLCRNPVCINPDHLEPVTRSENNRRGDLMRRKDVRVKTHCINGHEFPPVIARISTTGKPKGCVICRREAMARLRQRKKANG